MVVIVEGLKRGEAENWPAFRPGSTFASSIICLLSFNMGCPEWS